MTKTYHFTRYEMVSPETIQPVTGPGNRAREAVTGSGPLLGGLPTGKVGYRVRLPTPVTGQRGRLVGGFCNRVVCLTGPVTWPIIGPGNRVRGSVTGLGRLPGCLPTGGRLAGPFTGPRNRANRANRQQTGASTPIGLHGSLTTTEFAWNAS